MKIESPWFAVEDRTSIFDSIEQDKPRSAIAVDVRIMEQTEKPTRFQEG